MQLSNGYFVFCVNGVNILHSVFVFHRLSTDERPWKIRNLIILINWNRRIFYKNLVVSRLYALLQPPTRTDKYNKVFWRVMLNLLKGKLVCIEEYVCYCYEIFKLNCKLKMGSIYITFAFYMSDYVRIARIHSLIYSLRPCCGIV